MTQCGSVEVICIPLLCYVGGVSYIQLWCVEWRRISAVGTLLAQW